MQKKLFRFDKYMCVGETYIPSLGVYILHFSCQLPSKQKHGSGYCLLGTELEVRTTKIYSWLTWCQYDMTGWGTVWAIYYPSEAAL